MIFTNSDDKKIFYDVINNESEKEVLVFLNGVMASTSSWVNQYKVFKEMGYKIVLHDFVGQLRSDKFEGIYSFKKHAEDVDQLLQFLGTSSVHLIGTSYGGEVAMKYAVLYPNKVKSISVIDSVSELDEKLINDVNEWISLAKTYNGHEFFEGMMPSIYGVSYIKNNKESLAKRAKAMNKIPKEYFDGQIGLYKTFIEDVLMTVELKNILCPAVIIVGEEDTLKPIKFSRILVENIENSMLHIIPDCGHVTILEKPKQLNKILINFLNKINI